MAGEAEAELAEIGPGSALALILVVIACLLLTVLPAAVALQAPVPPARWVAWALGTFVGVIATLKLVAVTWGWAAQLRSAPPAREVVGDAS